ncbi:MULTISPECIES: glycosyltransferase [unclassified Sphingobacterium]|uniref:glycosyltransferase n=1 Tax=unclassified Sphingobacterium TaxID=2609468 RepID=UPI0025CF007A|nr:MULTISPECIES: glycosyltransferase [unclassified Sphingobacterium]
MRDEGVQVSVIVPVYNAGTTLERCVDSILHQSYVSFEVILVNDGSQDNSADICLRYSEKDDRIRVIHQENGGVSRARNTGLDIATGSYVTFIDSDDKIEAEYLKELMKWRDSDLVLCSSATFPDNRKTIFSDAVYNSVDDIGRCLSSTVVSGFTYPWGKLYRSSIIKREQLRFDCDLFSGEDTLFNNKYLLHINSLKVSSYEGYVYTHGRIGQLSSKWVTAGYLLDASTRINVTYSALENKYHVDLKFAKSDLIQFFLHRYISSLHNEGITSMAAKLKDICEHGLVHEIFYENYGNRKGKVQRMFDLLAQCKYYYLLVIFNKTIGRFFF